MAVKSRLSRSLRKSRKIRGQEASQAARFRGLRLESLETRCMLTGIPSLAGMGPIDDGPEGESGDPAFVPGQLMVEFSPGTSNAARNLILQQEGATLIKDFYGINFVLIDLPDEEGVNDEQPGGMDGVIAHWEANPWVVSAEPNAYVGQFDLIPNDPGFVYQWGSNNVGQTGGFPDSDIDAIEAWDMFTGSSSTVVAIIDSGVDYNHEDLRNNMWRNPGEIPGDGLDNDGNGYVDDIYGIAPAVTPTSVDPIDFNGHGTHVAGTVGAQGNNNIGVSGVNWDVSDDGHQHW